MNTHTVTYRIKGVWFRFEADSVKRAREAWEDDRDFADAGASECSRWPIIDTPEGRVYLSYNGRAWMDDPMKVDKPREYAE